MLSRMCILLDFGMKTDLKIGAELSLFILSFI